MIDVKTLRESLGVSHAQLAVAVGVSPARVQSWEQGRRQPNDQARILLELLRQKPDMLPELMRIGEEAETNHVFGTPANAAHIETSLAQAERGEVVEYKLD